MKVTVPVSNWFLCVLFFISGGIMSLTDKVVKGTTWAELYTPWYVVLFLSGGFFGLMTFMVTGHPRKGTIEEEDVNSGNPKAGR